MTTYYIKMEGDSNHELQFDSNILGNESFGTFYAERGMKILARIIETAPVNLKDVMIVTDMGKKYTITEFLDYINKLKVLFN